MKYYPSGEHSSASSAEKGKGDGEIKLRGRLFDRQQSERDGVAEPVAEEAGAEQSVVLRGRLFDKFAHKAFDAVTDIDTPTDLERTTFWTDLESLSEADATLLANEMMVAAGNAEWVGTTWVRNGTAREITDAYTIDSRHGEKTILKVRNADMAAAINMTPHSLESKLAEQLMDGEISEFTIPEI